MHDAGKIHGDIKSSNVLLTQNPEGGYTPHIVDFGIASLGFKNAGLSGTPEYFAPEIIAGGALDADGAEGL